MQSNSNTFTGSGYTAEVGMMEQFPFRIRGVHTDNGTEYANHTIGDWLQQSGIDFTRPRRSNDNGLVESKNAAVVRKWFGHAHIPQSCAERINQFTEEYLNPYLNFHRPCLFSRVTVDQRGKEKRFYPLSEVATPHERFRALSEAERHQSPEWTLARLDGVADAISDNKAVQMMHTALRQFHKYTHEQGRRFAEAKLQPWAQG